MAESVIKWYLQMYQTNCNTILDLDLRKLPFLNEQETVVNAKGQKVSKDYIAINGKLAAREFYERIVEDYTFNGITISDVFIGEKSKLEYYDWSGNMIASKNVKADLFNLSPVFLGDGNETLVGASSPQQCATLKRERSVADNYLQSQNPELYSFLYRNYSKQYDFYLKTGDATELISAIDNETDPEITAVLDSTVYQLEIPVRELIISNLQN